MPIGENTTGQVTYLTKSGRMSSMARSADGKPIPRGQFVQIVRTIGPQVLVTALSPDAGESDEPKPSALRQPGNVPEDLEI